MKERGFWGRLMIIAFILNQILNTCIATKQTYTHEWAINVEGGEDVARRLAQDYGFVFVGKILEDYYLLRHNAVSRRSRYPSRFYHKTLAQDPRVHWIEQQVVKKRVKRSLSYVQMEFNDPRWHKQWYLNRGEGLDMNVQKAWAMGVTGKGVAVTILDDGIERDHPDLVQNYDPKASYDVNEGDDDPSPRYDFTNENRHGTRCAGEVAAQANNSECGVGVAYDAKIGGVRMLDGDVTDSVEATSLSLNPQHIQIYSASWGPDDDGRTVDGPATLTRKAFHDGISRGRGGLGSIFVWASGNGGREFDSCNCDGYTNSIHTLSISSVTEKGKIPWYSEACSSTLATTYSSGSTGEKQIVTTDIRKSCTESHTGTSASAPLAAGLCALALQANPMLTWRDLQHIVVMTAKPDNLDDPNWTTNGVGRKVSHSFGYGLMDASAMVQLARNWTTVPPQHICERRFSDQNRPVPMNGKISAYINNNGCDGTNNHVRYLEHVQARITLKASNRGEIQIFLISPSETKSTLLAKRMKDTSKEGFNNWAFMSTHFWGELSQGRWILEIENGAGSSELKEWTLVIMGTKEHPQAQNITPPANAMQPFTCNGINEHGVCIECKSGYFKLQDTCVQNCPDHYFGIMQLVRLRSAGNDTQRLQKFQRHGICNRCHEACKTCRGPQVDDCFLCNDGYEKRDGMCKKELLLNFLDPDMLGFFIWVIVLCIAAIILFGVIFGLLQARDRHMLCWKGKRHIDDMKCRYNGLTLTREEIENDLENFDIIRNRNFRLASLPETNNPIVRVHVNELGGENPSSVNYSHTQNCTMDVCANSNSLLKKYLEYTNRQLPKENHYHANGGPLVHYTPQNSSNLRLNGDKIVGRKHTDSYVSYDINSSLTKTLGKDILNVGKGQGHLIYPGSRHSASSRH